MKKPFYSFTEVECTPKTGDVFKLCVWGDGILCSGHLKTETPSDMRMFVIFILSLFPQGSFLFEHHQRIKLS